MTKNGKFVLGGSLIVRKKEVIYNVGLAEPVSTRSCFALLLWCSLEDNALHIPPALRCRNNNTARAISYPNVDFLLRSANE